MNRNGTRKYCIVHLNLVLRQHAAVCCLVRSHPSYDSSHSSTRALWQQPEGTPSSESRETWTEIAVNFAFEESLFIFVGFFNTP
jgi:hypothetical protein